MQSTHTIAYLVHRMQLIMGLALAIGLSACGGGANGIDSNANSVAGFGNTTINLPINPNTGLPFNSNTAPPIVTFVSTNPVIPIASVYAEQCANPRANSPDKAGSLDTEKSWVRSYMNDTYLWYHDVPSVNASVYTAASYGSNYKSLDAYFRALKSPYQTTSGSLVDKFSFTALTSDVVNQQSGIASGYGIRFAFISNIVPRILRVLYVESGSPAQLAGVARGDTVTSINGVSIDSNLTTGIAVLNAGISPSAANTATIFGLQKVGTTISFMVTVTSSNSITVTPVTTVTSVVQGSRTVGYLSLNSFGVVSAESQLIAAVNKLKTANVNELVLDLRYNGGGYLTLSNELAWMLGGPTLVGKTYEKTTCNDKNPFSICNLAGAFVRTSQGFSTTTGFALPQLGLSRVFVLTTAATCSASESVINGLSPFMQVVRIGSTTCGKPYGFYYKDNCGMAYAAMHFKGENAAGFGDYSDGFAPTCQVGDDLSKQRGDPSERMFSAALGYLGTGLCPAPSSAIAQSSPFEKPAARAPVDNGFGYQILRSPLDEVRWLNPAPKTP